MFFPSKRDLLLETITTYRSGQSAFLELAIDPALPAEAQIDHLFHQLYAYHRAQAADSGHMHGCPVGNLVTELADTGDEGLRAQLAACLGDWQGAIAAGLRASAERGEITVADPERTADTLVAYVEGALLLAKSRNDAGTLLRLAPGARALITAG